MYCTLKDYCDKMHLGKYWKKGEIEKIIRRGEIFVNEQQIKDINYPLEYFDSIVWRFVDPFNRKCKLQFIVGKHL